MNTVAGKSVRTIILAKAPLPGLAKTRLIPALGEQGSSHLAAKLLEHSVAQAVLANIGPVELCVSPTILHPVWNTLALPPSIEWFEQGEGDLGERMARASRRVTTNAETFLLMGTDCPGLSADILRAAAQELNCHDALLMPATDGGYALLGMHQHLPALFTAMPWSTSRVAAITRQRILEAGWKLKQLTALHDIDEPQDLQYLPKHLAQYRMSNSHEPGSGQTCDPILAR